MSVCIGKNDLRAAVAIIVLAVGAAWYSGGQAGAAVAEEAPKVAMTPEEEDAAIEQEIAADFLLSHALDNYEEIWLCRYISSGPLWAHDDLSMGFYETYELMYCMRGGNAPGGAYMKVYVLMDDARRTKGDVAEGLIRMFDRDRDELRYLMFDFYGPEKYTMNNCHTVSIHNKGLVKRMKQLGIMDAPAKWTHRMAQSGTSDELTPEVENKVDAAENVPVLKPGASQRETEEVRGYREAAAQGVAEAQNKLGDCYYYGIGVAKDEAEAVKWYRKAAEQGLGAAQNSLGFCYYMGAGVAKDEAEAVKWYRKVAMQEVSSPLGIGINQEMDEFRWYSRLAARGHAQSQYMLGNIYFYGHGVPENGEEAAKWFGKAAAQGHVWAQYKFGLCYEEGVGVAKSEDEAVKWYRKAAAQDHEAAEEALKKIEK